MTDYTMKSKCQQLDRELKHVQNKYEQQNTELKTTIAKKDIQERVLKEAEGQLRIIKERYSDLQVEHENTLRKA